MADDPEIQNSIEDPGIDDGLSDDALKDESIVQTDELGRTKDEEGIPLEDLPLERRIQLAKNCANPYGTLKPGVWIDSIDTINAWLASTIEEIDDNNIKVHYDGWPNKWDEWMRIGSYKVAPFRKNSVGYTGQTKIAMRKNEYKLEDYQCFMEKMDTCIQNDLKGLGAIETTQFYRGTLFSALDTIMGRIYESEDGILEISVPFIKKCLELICTYFKVVPSLIEKFDEAKMCADLYLVDENVAIALCHKEFIEMMKTVFWGNPRCLRFYVKHDRDPEEPKTSICVPYKKRDSDQDRFIGEEVDYDELRELMFDDKNLGFGLFYEFLDHFQFHGGFDLLRKVLQRVVPFEDNPALPLDLIPEFTSPFKSCSSILNPEYTREMAEELQSIIVGRLKNVSDDSMKEMDKNTIHHIMSDFRDFLCLGLPEEVVDEQLESVKLGLALRFLKSPEMKKRLTGINEIKSIVKSTERVGTRMVHPKWQDDDSPRIRSRWLKPEYLINWIEENKLVEFLLGESSHVEVIKRSASLLVFLASHNHLSLNHLELLWKSQEDKHEATVLGVYETINEIASSLNQESILYLFEKINSMPIKKYNEQTVKFVKEFTLKSFEVFRSLKGSELVDVNSDNDEEESKINEFIVDNAKGIIEGTVAAPNSDMPEFGLPILFEILQQNSELGGHTLSEFIDLLKESTSDSCKASYILKCIKNMMEGVAVYQSIRIFMSVFNLAFNYRSFEIELNSEVAIKKLNDQFDFISLTIKNIERYNALVQKQMVASVNKGLVPENVSKTKFEGNVTHAEQLDKLLEFIENIISISDNRVEIGTANIQKLWNIFVSASSIEFDKNTFFKWLCKESAVYSTSMMMSSNQSLLNEEEKTFLFEQILCKNEYVQKKDISLSCFKCFKKYFGLDNKYIAFSHRSYKVFSFDDIKGMDSLWEIVLYCQDSKVKEDSLYLLCWLHLHLSPQSFDQEEKEKIWAIFVNKCLDHLKSDDKAITNSAILALNKFFDTFDGKNIEVDEVSSSSCFPIRVYSADENSEKNVQVPYTENILYAKRKIAEAFDLGVNDFTIFVGGKSLGPEENDTAIRDIGFNVMYMIRKNKKDASEPHPKNILVGNQEFFNLMFDLLSNDEDYDVDNIWKLLMKLPQDEVPTAIKLNKLDISSEAEWEELIDGHSLHKMLYSLQIISNKSQNSENEWLAKFLMIGGYQHLFSTLLKIDPSKIISNLSFKSVDILVRLICISMEKHDQISEIEGAPNLLEIYREHSIVAIDKILRIIHQITLNSISDCKKRGDSYDDLFYKNKKLEQQSMRLLSYYEKSKSDNEQEEQNTYARKINELNKKFDEGGKFILLSFKLFYYLDCFNNETCIQQFIEFPDLSSLLRNILFVTDNVYLRNNFGDSLKEVCANVQNELQMFLEFKKMIMLKLIYDMDEVASENHTRAYKAIEIVQNILSGTRTYQLERMNIDFEEILKRNVKIIFEKETIEKSSNEFDHIIFGAMGHTKLIIQQFPRYKDKYGKILLKFLLHQCLFEVPKSAWSMNKVRPPKCKSSNSRVAAFSLINVLCRDNIENIQVVLEYLTHLEDKSGWRTKLYRDWTISPHTDEKSQTGYVGIKNLGCIWYMISMLQQLYMIPSFRESVLAIDDPKKEETPKEDNLLFHLQCIFAFLNQSEQQYFNPQGFTNAFKDWDGNPTNVLIQMDVDEFFNMFMDKLEFAIKGSKQEKMIQDHFGGQYANELICKGCPHYSESKEPYLAVTLQVKNKKSIKDSLEALIEGEMLDGDNAYYCEKCDKKVSTLKRTCIKKLPRHLIMVLKRFEFDYNYMQKLKVNDYCEFPESINMEPYTQEGLKRREEQAKREEKKGEDDEEPLEPKYPLELYDYKLSGVLVHSGVADGGHYYSFIKDRELTDKERWYEFNDELVKDFDKEDLESECFGGEEKWGDSQFNHFLSFKNTEKNRNAYVLFYERVSKEDIPYENEDEEQPAQPADNKEESDIVMDSEHHEEDIEPLEMKRSNTIKVPNEIGDMIEEDNRKYWQSRFMFSSQYSDFILELWSLWNTRNITLYNYDTRNRDYAQKGIDEAAFKNEVKRISEVNKINHSEHYSANKNIKVYSEKVLLPSESIDIYQKYGGEKIDMIEFEIFKQVATFYLTVKQRAVPKELVPEILDLIKAYLNKSIKACRWLITQFSNKEVLYENLVTCPIPDMRKLTGGLVYCAMIHLYEEEKDILQEYWEYKAGQREFYSNSHLLNFINLLICNIEDMANHTENNSQYFCLLAKFAGLGPQARIYLLRAKILARLNNFYLQDSSPDADKFEDDKTLIYEENETPEVGLPTSVENAYISIWEEMIMKKRDAAIADGVQDYVHIWELYSLCFRSCQIGEASDLDSFIDHVRFKELDESDWRLCILEEVDYIALIKTCTTRIANRFMGDFLIHAMMSVPGLEDKIKNVMITEIHDKQLDEIEWYFPIFKRYLLIQDDNAENRLAEGIKSYLQIIEDNVKFPSFMARFTAFLVKLCNKSRAVAEYLAASPDEWDWIIDWMRKNPNTSKNGHNLKVFTRESANSQYKIKRLEDIKKGEITTYENEYDSDDDLYNEKSYTGKKYDANFLGQAWVTAEVHVALDEMINISYSHNNIHKSPWISSEVCEYAPHMAMQNRHDVVMIEEFKKIIREQYRSTIQQQEDVTNQMPMSDGNGNFYDENHGYESVSDD